MQWHPLFAKVLRLLVQEHYDVQTNVPVGDVPREADILLLRRKRRRPPFRGLWRNLTEWNIMEFKGQTVFARAADLPLLIELGLGIHRRLNEERKRADELQRSQRNTSFWYVANELGGRFLQKAEGLLGRLEPITSGVWQCQVLGHLVFLVSSVAAPVERDTTPLHLVAEESLDTERELAQVIVDEPGLWEMYSPYLSTLHKNIWKEAKSMARSKKKTIADFIDLRFLIKEFGVKNFKASLDADDLDEMIQAIGLDEILAHLTPEQQLELHKRTAKHA